MKSFYTNTALKSNRYRQTEIGGIQNLRLCQLIVIFKNAYVCTYVLSHFKHNSSAIKSNRCKQTEIISIYSKFEAVSTPRFAKMDLQDVKMSLLWICCLMILTFSGTAWTSPAPDPKPGH
jgi:hypothetical protein